MYKSILTIIGAFLIILSVSAQQDINLLYKQKAEKYGKMKRTGTTLLMTGIGLDILSIALISSAEWHTETYDGQTNITTNDAEGVIGTLAALSGLGLTITGAILTGVGNKKHTYYKNKYNQSSLLIQPMSKPYCAGLKLTYRF